MSDVPQSRARPGAGALGLGLVCLAAALWGTVGVASRLLLEPARFDPVSTGLVRTALGAVCLFAVAALVPAARRDRRPPPWGPLVAFALGGAAFQICLFAAFDRIGVTLTTAITVCAPPVIVAACDAAFGRRRPDGPLIAAIAGAGVGVALLLWPDGGAAPGGAIDLVGLGLLAGASFSFAAVAVAARALGRALHPVRAAGYGLAAVAGALALVGGASAGGTLAALSGACWRDLGLLAYLGVAATGGAYLAFVGGMRLSRSAATGLAATMVEPAFAGVLAALILGERIGPVAALGCALAFGAVVLLHREETRAAAVVP